MHLIETIANAGLLIRLSSVPIRECFLLTFMCVNVCSKLSNFTAQSVSVFAGPPRVVGRGRASGIVCLEQPGCILPKNLIKCHEQQNPAFWEDFSQ